jgi:hypothetical protein
VYTCWHVHCAVPYCTVWSVCEEIVRFLQEKFNRIYHIRYIRLLFIPYIPYIPYIVSTIKRIPVPCRKQHLKNSTRKDSDSKSSETNSELLSCQGNQISSCLIHIRYYCLCCSDFLTSSLLPTHTQEYMYSLYPFLPFSHTLILSHKLTQKAKKKGTKKVLFCSILFYFTLFYKFL